MPQVLYYDDQKRPIATSDAELLIYFKSIAGTIAVANVPFLMDCPMNALFRVVSSGTLPKYIYKGGTSPANKIFLQQLPSATANLNSLCNGVNNKGLVPPPVLGTIQGHKVIVPVPVLGTIQGVPLDNATLNLVGYDNSGSGGGIWIINPSYSSAFVNSGVVTLNVSVKNSIFNNTNAKDNFVNVKIAQIAATPGGGHPQNIVSISSSNNGNLPASSSLMIYPNGDITYTGQPTSEDVTGSKIEFFSVQFNILD